MDLKFIIGDVRFVPWGLLGILLVSFLFQSYYYLVVYLKLPRSKPRPAGRKKSGVSVVICARNEAENLENFLPRILTQDYPDFEVVVVNDRSTDETENVLSNLSVKYKHLRYTSIPLADHVPPGKKLALAIGLKSARNDRVLLTDADCYPVSDQWICRMTAPLGKEKKIVLGYGRYERRKGLLNLLIRYDTLFSAIQFLSYALRGKPYMGVGRNLSYDKNLFFNGTGFSRHYHIASGDDDLFVNEHAVKGNTAVEWSPESQTVSIPEKRWGKWIRQKRRHLSAGKLYYSASRIRLGTEYVSRIFLYASFVLVCTLFSELAWPALILFGLFQIVRMTVFKMAMAHLNEKYLLLPSLLLDPLMPFILGFIWFSNIFITKHQPWS